MDINALSRIDDLKVRILGLKTQLKTEQVKMQNGADNLADVYELKASIKILKDELNTLINSYKLPQSGPIPVGRSTWRDVHNLHTENDGCVDCGSQIEGVYIIHPTFGYVKTCCARAAS
jgi:hypothetical protein